MAAVDASRANVSADSDNAPVIDLRSDESVLGGGLAWASPDVVTAWHSHPYHQLECALSGTAEVQTESGRYLLPPQQAIWIPCGVKHSTTLRGVRSVSVFLHPTLLPAEGEWPRIMPATPLLREMISYATRWPIDRCNEGSEIATGFFRTLGMLILEWIEDEVPYWLPVPRDAVVAAAVVAAEANLATADTKAIAGAIGVSERTLRRRFVADINMTWSQYLSHARVLRAMTMLVTERRSVAHISAEVGFASTSGFTRAFRALAGTSPAQYRTMHTDRS